MSRKPAAVPDFGTGTKPAAKTALHVAAIIAALLDDQGQPAAAQTVRRMAPEVARQAKA